MNDVKISYEIKKKNYKFEENIFKITAYNFFLYFIKKNQTIQIKHIYIYIERYNELKCRRSVLKG